MIKDVYEVEEKLKYLIENNVDENGIIDPEVEAQVNDLYEEREFYIGQLVNLIKNAEALADGIDKQIAELQERKRIVLNRIPWLNYQVLRNLKEGEKIEADNYKITWRKSTSVDTSMVDAEKIWNEDKDNVVFLEMVNKVEKVEYKLDKKKILAYYKEGMKIPDGIEIVKKNTMTIK
jgi:hypothetical protein